ncbi:MAG: Kef-type transport system rane protein [Bacteroidetes bacterium]|nr:Kef-type transport system rane protein [Bacteroidota bacterium]
MIKLAHNELIVLLLSISAMLIISRIFAELGKKLKLPVVMGELIVGIILGPTVLGMLCPDIFTYLFPRTGNIPIALDGIFSLSVIMLLFVAGMEVQLSLVLKQGKVAVYTSLFSMVIPFFTGFAVAWFFPEIFSISNEPAPKLLFALFFGTALSISALPVIARILMDMNLFKTNIGMVIIASAMFNDLIGWLIFSMVLSLTNGAAEHLSIWYTIGYIIGFGLFMLTIGKRIIDKTLPWMQTKLSWPGGVLSISLGICLLSAAFTEAINIHAILGAFIAGIAFGDSVHLREQAREIIHQFVTNFFAPLFFVSIGLKVNFIENFDPLIVAIVLVLAYVGKVLGATIGARVGGMSKKHSWAVGFGMNARGAMEIILGTLALNAGLISKPIFVALVIMALVTSLTSGPLMKKFID